MKYLLPLAAAIALLGCQANAPRAVTLPNGKQGYTDRCDGTVNEFRACMKAAEKVCGGHYEIVEREQPLPPPYPARGAAVGGKPELARLSTMTFTCG